MSQDFQKFNKFQNDFYRNSFEFNKYSNYEKTSNIFALLHNMAKGFPHLAQTYFDLYSPHVKTLESPAIIDALHKRFCNDFSENKMPNFIYFKAGKAKKSATATPKPRKKKTDVVFIDFEKEVVFEILSTLFMDSKTYQFLKNTPRVQRIGIQIMSKSLDIIKQK